MFAATFVGVYRSLDRGETWTRPGSGSTIGFCEALATSHSSLFVGAADGLHRSTDDGRTWQHVLAESRVQCVAATHERRLVLVGTETAGVLRSEDDGKSWSGANAGLLDLNVLAIGLSSRFDVDGLGFVGTTSGLYRTRNAARSWRAMDLGVDAAVQCLAVSQDHIVVAGTEADGLLCSQDAGSTWHRPPALAERSVSAVAFSRSGTLAVATDVGIAISKDGASSWDIVSADTPSVLSLLFATSADDAEVLFAATDRQGIYRSLDGGRTWAPANAGCDASLHTILVASTEMVLVGGHDVGVRVSTDSGETWCEASAGFGDAAVSGLARAGNRTVFAATSQGVFRSDSPGAAWHVCSVDAAVPVRAVASAGAHVYAALENGRLLTSGDDGRTWLGLATPFEGSNILALAVSPDSDAATFAATSAAAETVVWRSQDGGAHWQRWLVEPGRSASAVLAVSPNYRADQLLVVGLESCILFPSRHVDEVQHGERRPAWHRSTVAPGAPRITSAAFGADRRVFVSSNRGIFISRDGGATFASWSEGIEERPVLGLGLTPTDAFALELGGRVWRRHLSH
jgi:photosystem II stability/assembly factor-like uncharacterized protein